MSSEATYRSGLAALVAIGFEVLLAAACALAWWGLHTLVPSFQLGQPRMAWALAAGPIALVLFLIDTAWRDRALRRFAQPATLARMVPGVSAGRTLGRYLLLRAGLLLAALALMAPRLGARPEVVKAKGIDLMLCVDVSHSMECEDIKPSRLMAAKLAMLQLLDRLQGDRLGIVVFAGEAFVQLPITTDRSAARLFIHNIGPQSVNAQGTAIGAAIDLAQRAFRPESEGGKAIIVISDGENHEDDAVAAAQAAAAEGIVVHAVGIGTPKGGPIPLRRGGQGQGFRKDRSGATVVTRLDEGLLRRIASVGNGSYVRATAGSTGIVELVQELQRMEQAEVGTVRYTAYDDLYQWPLGAALACFLLHLLIGERRNPRALWRATAA